MTENKSSIAYPEIENQADLSIVLTQIKAGEYTEALLTAQQINNESQKIESLKAIANAAHSDEHQTIALRALLHLPVAERNAILAQQVEESKDCFLPGSEEMEWVEGYIEDDNWDDE